MKDIIIASLATFIFTFGLVVNIESKIKADQVENGFIIIGDKTYLLTEMRVSR